MSAGLGSPPANFTTNASESLNAAIKGDLISKNLIGQSLFLT